MDVVGSESVGPDMDFRKAESGRWILIETKTLQSRKGVEGGFNPLNSLNNCAVTHEHERPRREWKKNFST